MTGSVNMGVKEFLTTIIDRVFRKFGYHHLKREDLILVEFLHGEKSIIYTICKPSKQKISFVYKCLKNYRRIQDEQLSRNRKRFSRKKTCK